MWTLMSIISMSHILVTAGLIYVGVATSLVALTFLFLHFSDRPTAQGVPRSASASVRSIETFGEDCGFTDEQVARLITYRNAVRAGYFTDEIQPRASRSLVELKR
jgi:hypothetical protein